MILELVDFQKLDARVRGPDILPLWTGAVVHEPVCFLNEVLSEAHPGAIFSVLCSHIRQSFFRERAAEGAVLSRKGFHQHHRGGC